MISRFKSTWLKLKKLIFCCGSDATDNLSKEIAVVHQYFEDIEADSDQILVVTKEFDLLSGQELQMLKHLPDAVFISAQKAWALTVFLRFKENSQCRRQGDQRSYPFNKGALVKSVHECQQAIR